MVCVYYDDDFACLNESMKRSTYSEESFYGRIVQLAVKNNGVYSLKGI